jgi:hypothetical protein
MSVKTILGLDNCPLTDWEIMQKIADAQRRDIRVIEFSNGGRAVQISFKGINPKGIMKDYEQRFEDF